MIKTITRSSKKVLISLFIFLDLIIAILCLFWKILGGLSSLVLPPPAPNLVSHGNRLLRVLVGIGDRKRITTDDDVSSPIHLNRLQEAKAKRARVRWQL